MAQIGSVNATFTASVGGLTSGVEAAGKAFKSLGGDASTLRSSLSQLQKIGSQSVADIGPAATSARAAVSQFSQQIASLRNEFVSGAATASQFASGMAAVTAQAQAAARATADAVAITREQITAEQSLMDELDRIAAAVKLGGLAEDIAARAREAAYSTYLNSATAAGQEADAVDGLVNSISGLAGIDIPNPFAGVAEEFAASIQGLATETETFNTAIIDAEIAMELAAEEAAIAAAAMEAMSAAHARGAAVALAHRTAEEQYADTVGELNLLLAEGAISQETYQRATEAAAAKMRSASNASNEMATGLGGITSRLNVLIGLDIARLFASIASSIAGTVGSFARMGQAEAGVIDQTAKLAARIGVTYGEMAGLSVAAQKSGVALDSISNATNKADVAFVKAAQGSAEATAAFDSIGLSVRQLNGLSTAERFNAIAAAIAELPTEAERAAAATRIFGQSGADLLPLFAQGAAGIRAASEEADRFGLSLTNAQGKDVSAMVSAFQSAQRAIQGVVQQVTAYLSPVITAVVEQFNQFIGDIGGANIGQMIGEGILTGAEYLAGIGDWLISSLSGVWDYVSQVGQQWNAVVAFLGRIVSLFSGVFNAATAGFKLVVLSITGTFETLATIAQKIGSFLGFDTASLDVIVAGAKGFNDELSNGITKNLAAAGEGFKNAFGDNAQATGQAIAGPLTQTVRAAREAAKASADAVDEAKKTPVEIEQTVEVAGIAQALKAVDSRSSAGYSEALRLMRGDTGNIQEQQLDALSRIVENTAGMEPMPAVSLAGA